MKKRKNIFVRNQRKSIFKRKGFKQALSLIMILFMCLVLLPVSPIEAAGETYTVYFDASSKPDDEWFTSSNYKFIAHAWKDDANSKNVDMVKSSNNIYKCEIPSDYTNIIFVKQDTNGAWKVKTPDLIIPSGYTSPCFKYSGKVSSSLNNGAYLVELGTDYWSDLGETTETEKDDIFFAKSTFYDYYGKNVVGNTAKGAVTSNHYYFENFNEKISNYAEENGVLYPLYFGDFNEAYNKSDYPEDAPSTGQPLGADGLNAYNFYWAINRASRTDKNDTNNTIGNKYTASVQGLASESLVDGNIMQRARKPIITEVACDFSKINVTQNDSATYAAKIEFKGEQVINFNGGKKTEGKVETAFNAKVTAKENGYNFGASSTSKYLYFDIYTESSATGSPFIAIKDSDSNLHQMAAWSDGVAKDGYDNKITKGEWKTIAIDLSKLKNATGNGSSNAGSVDLSKIDSIYFGFWNNDSMYIKNIKFVSEEEGPETEVEMPYFSSSFLSSNAIGETTSEMQFPFKKRTKYVDGKPCDYYIFTSGKTGYKSDASNVEKATTDVIRINNETNSLDYWFDVADDDSNIVRDMNGTTGWGTGKNSPGLFPFNKYSDSSDVNKLNYGFGAKIEIPFTLTEDGKVYPQNSQNDAEKVPMKFNFKGDDDVWVYIDGNLVLDMGGGHTQTTGNIDFANNIATVDNVVNAPLTSNSLHEPVVTKTKSFNLNGETAAGKYDTEKVHTMTVYYMERGMIESNLYIDFNFVPEQNDLIVEKEVNTDGVNPVFENVVNDIAKNKTEFNFNLSNKKQSEIISEIEDTFTYEGDSANKYIVYNDLEDTSKVISSGATSIVKSKREDNDNLITEQHKAVLAINQSKSVSNEDFRTEIDSILLDASGVKDLSSVSNYLIFDIYNNSNDNNAANSYPFVALRDSNGKQIAGWCTTSYTYNGVDSYINRDKKGKWVTVCVDLSKLKGNTKNGANDPSNFDFSKVKNIWIGYWASGTIYLDNVIFSSRPEMPSNITTKVESITNTNFTTVSNFKYDEKNASGNIEEKQMTNTDFKLKDKYTATFYDKFQKNTQVIGKETEDRRFNTTWITKDLSGTEETVLGTGTGIITDPFTISTDHKDTTHMTHYIKFTNSVKTSNLSIEKKLSDDLVTDDIFKFKVIFKNIFGSKTENINYNGKYTITSSEGSSEKNATLEDGSYVIEIKAGETAQITGIPVGTEYEIQEISQEGYEIESIKVDSKLKTIHTKEETIENGIKVTITETNTDESKLIDSTGTKTTQNITTKTTVNTTTIVDGKKVTTTEGPNESTSTPAPVSSEEKVTNSITGTIANGTVSNKITFTNVVNKGSITINKVDEDDNKLNGAGFKIEKKIIIDPSTAKKEDYTDSKYDISNFDKGYVWEKISEIKDDAKVTNEFKFTDLLKGEYRITEIKVPNGYVGLAKPIEVTLPYAYKVGDEVNGKTMEEAGETMNITYKVENKKELVLPLAGFNGIGLYLCIGSVVIISALIMFSIYLRKTKKTKINS